jgi:hypothetical protein
VQTSDSGIERRRAGQRGSALLIVFVFAAFVAIMLYKEMPVTLFEAKRQKEQLLIDRGTEYKRAIKLFVIRNRTFPTSLDQLEKFNNVRYIRHRFKDPMTGADEWRLIHVAGPGFVLTDSKVNPLKKVDGKTGLGTSAGSAGAGTDPNQGGSAASPSEQAVQQQNTQPTVDSVAYVTPGQPVVYHLYPNQTTGQNQAAGQTQTPGQPSAQIAAGPRSRPAVPAANFAAQQQVATQVPTEANNENPTSSLPEMLTSDGSSEPVEQDNTEAAESAVPEQAGEQSPVTPPSRPAAGALPQQAAGMQNPAMQQNAPAQFNAANPRVAAALGNNAQQTPDPAAVSPEGMAAVQNMLRRGGTVPTGSATASNKTTISSGAIAGVASKATGKSIKQIEKQTDYSKWEFVYDPQKEPKVIAGSIGSGMAGGVANGTGTSFGGSQNGRSNSTSGFGNSNSSFGNSNSGFGSSSSGFGNSNTGSGNSRSGFGTSSSGFGNSPASAPSPSEPVANDTN